MSIPTLGKSTTGAPIHVDVERLVSTRMLLTANSGGGKSWALRRILEQTHGVVQHIVIDPESEFYTLREKYDYVLAGKGGDCPAEPRSAALLARRLLELGTSAILDLYELAPQARVRFVRLFLEALLNAPKELRHPTLVIVDEAHTFAPEKGSAESCEAVACLMAQGRKRGLAGVLATQRLSKLSKDVAAEANNLLVGRAALDNDQKRAAEVLGMTKAEAIDRLRRLEPGHFFAFGPAISPDVVELVVGNVVTSHPKTGQSAAPPPPPRERVKKILGQLADLPKEAEDEARTIADARATITRLERELAAARKVQPEATRVEVPAISAKELSRLERIVEVAMKTADKLSSTTELRAIVSEAQAAGATLRTGAGELMRAITPRAPARSIMPSGVTPVRVGEEPRNGHAPAPRRAPSSSIEGRALDRCARAMLQVLAQRDTTTATQLSVLTGYSRKSSSFANSLGMLRSSGLAEGGGDAIRITDSGRAAAGDVDPLPTGEELVQHWMSKLEKAERAMLEVLVRSGARGVTTKEELADASGYSVTSSSFANAIGKLRTLELAEGYGPIRASATLLE